MENEVSRILVVDDDNEIVQELCELLTDHGYRCIGTCTTQTAQDVFREDLKIGIVLCDLHMPEQNGIELVRSLDVLAGPGRPFEAVIFTGQTESMDVINAMRAGIADYLQKPIETEQILSTVARLQERLHERQREYRELGQLNRKLKDLTDSINELYEGIHNRRRPGGLPPVLGERQTDPIPAPFDQLSPRQLAVARLVGKGLTNYQIACELNITENTVKLYVSQVLRLTHMHNRTQLALALAPGQSGISVNFR